MTISQVPYSAWLDENSFFIRKAKENAGSLVVIEETGGSLYGLLYFEKGTGIDTKTVNFLSELSSNCIEEEEGGKIFIVQKRPDSNEDIYTTAMKCALTIVDTI